MSNKNDDNDDDDVKISFWQTMPGCITAIAGLLTAIVAAVITLSAAGFIKPPFPATDTPPAPSFNVISVPSTPTHAPVPLNPTSAPPTSIPPTSVPPTNTAIPDPQPIIIEFDNQGPLWDTNCNSIRQDMSSFASTFWSWSEGDHLLGGGLKCELGFALIVDKNGTYALTLTATYAPDFGILRVSMVRGPNTDSVSTIDLYGPLVKPTEPIDLGRWFLGAEDDNYLVFVVERKNFSSTEYRFGLDYLTLGYIQRGLP